MNKFPNLNSFDYSIYLFFCFVCLYYFLKIYFSQSNKLKDLDLPSFTWLLFLFPFSSLLFIVMSDNFYTLLTLDFKSFIMIISLLISNIILFFIYVNFVQAMYFKNKFEISNYKDKYSSKKYDLLNIQYKNNFHFLHDMLNEYQKIDNLMTKQNYKLAQEQLHQLADLTYHNFNDLYTDSIVLNYLLTNKQKIIKQNNIQILSLLQYTDFTFMDFCDQIDFFGIMLDYIISYVISYNDEKFISIKSSLKNNFLVLNFQFPSPAKIMQKEFEDKISSLLQSYEYNISIKELDNHIISIIFIFKNIKLYP